MSLSEQDLVYKQFETYDFTKSPSYRSTLEQVYSQYLIVLSDKDLEVKQDLSQGVFNPDRIPTEDREQLDLQTKIFVFCSETDNILEIQEYLDWSEANGVNKQQPKIQEVTEQEDPNPVLNVDVSDKNVHSTESDVEAGYTSNYEQIVDMIVNNKPIPGIKQIPTTILDPEQASENVLQQRKKPWEKDDVTSTT